MTATPRTAMTSRRVHWFDVDVVGTISMPTRPKVIKQAPVHVRGRKEAISKTQMHALFARANRAARAMAAVELGRWCGSVLCFMGATHVSCLLD